MASQMMVYFFPVRAPLGKRKISYAKPFLLNSIKDSSDLKADVKVCLYETRHCEFTAVQYSFDRLPAL